MAQNRIQVLPDGIANQIAAGEVVGRPASVVKELMENAIDAGSSSVTVCFREGGRGLIQVVDNGCGMDETDARMAFERHATSKIRTTNDLFALHTLGFRGEALPSIASVCEMEMLTRTAESEMGTKVVIQGGEFIAQECVQTPCGTQFLVKNLFYNVPARRKFLKDAPVEARHITAEFRRIALCNPQVAFSLYNHESVLYSLPAGNLRQRILGVHGRRLSDNLLEVNVDTSVVRIEGFVAHPKAAKKTTPEQYFFINGRYFRSPYLHKAVMQAFHKLIPHDAQPPYVLKLEVDTHRLDVNVHPAKTEVKFEDETSLWQILNAAIRESLGKLGVVPMMDFEADPSLEIPVFQQQGAVKVPESVSNPHFNPFDSDKQNRYAPSNAGGGAYTSPKRDSVLDSWQGIYENQFDKPLPMVRDSQSLSMLTPRSAQQGEDSTTEGGSIERNERLHTSLWETQSDESDQEHESALIEYIQGEEATQGTLEIETASEFGNYIPLSRDRWVVTMEGNVGILELTRAQERISYERILHLLSHQSAVTQQLLFPEQVELPVEVYELMRSSAETFNSLGFEYTLGEGTSITILGSPPDLPPSLLGETLIEMAEQMLDEEEQAIDRRQAAVAAVMARQLSRKSTATWSSEAVANLLSELMGCENKNYTPSGRPIWVWITPEELNNRF